MEEPTVRDTVRTMIALQLRANGFQVISAVRKVTHAFPEGLPRAKFTIIKDFVHLRLRLHSELGK